MNDAAKQPIPDDLLFVWQDDDLLRDAKSLLVQAENRLKKFARSPGGFGYDWAGVAGYIRSAKRLIACEMRRVVCVACPGEGCTRCGGRQWHHSVKPDNRPATPAQERVLRKHNKFVEGMGFAEASKAMDNLAGEKQWPSEPVEDKSKTPREREGYGVVSPKRESTATLPDAGPRHINYKAHTDEEGAWF